MLQYVEYHVWYILFELGFSLQRSLKFATEVFKLLSVYKDAMRSSWASFHKQSKNSDGRNSKKRGNNLHFYVPHFAGFNYFRHHKHLLEEEVKANKVLRMFLRMTSNK